VPDLVQFGSFLPAADHTDPVWPASVLAECVRVKVIDLTPNDYRKREMSDYRPMVAVRLGDYPST
jgi:hypothetical protein